MSNAKVQTEPDDFDCEKSHEKPKMKRARSAAVLGAVAGGAIAGAVFGGIYAAVKLFTKSPVK